MIPPPPPPGEEKLSTKAKSPRPFFNADSEILWLHAPILDGVEACVKVKELYEALQALLSAASAVWPLLRCHGCMSFFVGQDVQQRTKHLQMKIRIAAEEPRAQSVLEFLLGALELVVLSSRCHALEQKIEGPMCKDPAQSSVGGYENRGPPK